MIDREDADNWLELAEEEEKNRMANEQIKEREVTRAKIDEAQTAYWTWKDNHEDFGATQCRRIEELKLKYKQIGTR